MSAATSIHPKYIEIDGGTVKVSVTDAGGNIRHVAHGHGRVEFFVELVEHDGGRVGLWSGPDYEDAIREAERARREWKIDEPVRDLIAGGR